MPCVEQWHGPHLRRNTMAEDLQTQFDDAVFAYTTGDYAAAVAGFEAVLAAEPEHFEARLSLGMAFYRKENYAAAIEAGHAAEAAARVQEHVAGALDDNLATGAPECRWCPVCRGVHAMRQVSPEVRAHLGAAASSLVQAAAALMATTPPSGRSRDVETIDLDDEPDDETEPRTDPGDLP